MNFLLVFKYTYSPTHKINIFNGQKSAPKLLYHENFHFEVEILRKKEDSA